MPIEALIKYANPPLATEKTLRGLSYMERECNLAFKNFFS